jgi:hypothetical protein
MFIPFNMIQTGVDNVYVYLSADILFETIMAATGFVTVYWLYKPLTSVLQKLELKSIYQTANVYK